MCNVQQKLGPVVKSIFSLTSLLMTNWLTAVAKVFSNTLIFCCKNMNSFCNTKATHIFQRKNINIFAIFQDRNFNFTLFNDLLKFWTTGTRSAESIFFTWNNVYNHSLRVALPNIQLYLCVSQNAYKSFEWLKLKAFHLLHFNVVWQPHETEQN